MEALRPPLTPSKNYCADSSNDSMAAALSKVDKPKKSNFRFVVYTQLQILVWDSHSVVHRLNSALFGGELSVSFTIDPVSS
jgi:hypothetical protein